MPKSIVWIGALFFLTPVGLCPAALSAQDSAPNAGQSSVQNASTLVAPTNEPERAQWRERISSATLGETLLSAHQRTEYARGSIALILAAPHGGRLEPSDLPNRTEGVIKTDSNVDRLAKAVSQSVSKALLAVDNASTATPRPHLILCNVHRRKLDANRPLETACATDSPARENWHEYQQAIVQAKQFVTDEHGRGLFVELHGHGHPIARLELGYLLRQNEFELPASGLNALASRTSIHEITRRAQFDTDQLLRGEASLGHFLASENIDAVPSPKNPRPGNDPYFNGGWNTLQHGSRDHGTISSIQIECHYRGVRDSQASIESSADSLARALVNFLKIHYPANR